MNKTVTTTCPVSCTARAGFTAIEITIVLLIIGMLAAVSMPLLSKARIAARAKQAQGQLELIAAAIRHLTWDSGKWPNREPLANPGNPEVWDLKAAAAGLLGKTSAYAKWHGPYIRDIPRDPWGNPYFFDPDYTIGSKVKAVVGSFGPNGSGRNVYDKDNIYIVLD
jgi:general secretion pathway protein G